MDAKKELIKKLYDEKKITFEEMLLLAETEKVEYVPYYPQQPYPVTPINPIAPYVPYVSPYQQPNWITCDLNNVSCGTIVAKLDDKIPFTYTKA